MTNHITKTWFDGKTVVTVTKEIPVGEVYKREWVNLTAEEIHGIEGYKETRQMYRFARDLEAKLKEKNNAV